MSFLTSPRIAFTGRFLSDVSTINNLNDGGDVGWNPQGGAAFELLNCKVSGAWLPEAVPGEDPVLGYCLEGRPDGSSAKMVDLDPDFQKGSQLWALWIRLFDPQTGDLAFMGRYSVASFRDIWLRQVKETMQPAGAPNAQPMGARYASTLRELEWGRAAERSDLLMRLRDASPTALSISLHQFGYFYATDQPRYRTASLIGSIGPRRHEDPETVLVGRRLPGVRLNAGLPALGMVDLEVAADASAISMDLGHALPIDNADGVLTDLGQWPVLPQLAGCTALVLGLAQPDFAPWGKPSAPVAVVGDINPFKAGWYQATGGVVEFSLSEAQAGSIKGAPLALYGRLADGSLVAITREAADGLFVRADGFVFRMEAGDEAEATIVARRFGVAAEGVTIYLTPDQPLVPPALKLPDTVVTGPGGTAVVKLQASDPGAPRQGEGVTLPSPDGQVYILGYSALPPAAGQTSRTGTGLTDWDVLAVHLRQDIAVPAAPTWEDDVQPILANYAALYPIMSQHLFNIADYDTLVAHRALLRMAFSRRVDDPNYMPVTRDLSRAKREIIIKWLEHDTGDPKAPLRRSAKPAAASPPGPVQAFIARTPTAQDHDVKRDEVAPFDPLVPSTGKAGHDDQG